MVILNEILCVSLYWQNGCALPFIVAGIVLEDGLSFLKPFGHLATHCYLYCNLVQRNYFFSSGSNLRSVVATSDDQLCRRETEQRQRRGVGEEEEEGTGGAEGAGVGAIPVAQQPHRGATAGEGGLVP